MAVKGLVKVLKSLDKLGKEAKDGVHIVTGDTSTQIALGAINNAPIDLGKLRQGIKSIELGYSNFKVMTNVNNIAPYTAYMEFGTGGLVKVPNELKDIAIKFKGKGVKEVNISPRPFLYPAFVKGRKQYLKDLKDLLEYLTKKNE